EQAAQVGGHAFGGGQAVEVQHIIYGRCESSQSSLHMLDPLATFGGESRLGQQAGEQFQAAQWIGISCARIAAISASACSRRSRSRSVASRLASLTSRRMKIDARSLPPSCSLSFPFSFPFSWTVFSLTVACRTASQNSFPLASRKQCSCSADSERARSRSSRSSSGTPRSDSNSETQFGPAVDSIEMARSSRRASGFARLIVPCPLA